MKRMLPPLNPLRAFEAAGRHVSFTRAAEELGVTQTAVSRQVAVLEAYMRCRLFERHNSALVLTDAGQAYLNSIQPAMETIGEATAMTRGQSSNVVKARVYLTFALRWLLPRLPRFRAAHPKIEINLSTSLLPADFERDDLDVNICHGGPEWPGVSSLLIFKDRLTPTCSPALIESLGRNLTPADLVHQPLLHSRNRIADWGDWFRFAGVDVQLEPGITFETSSLVYEGARQGLGFALSQVALVKGEIERGELCAPFPAMARESGYFFLHKTGRIEAKTRIFRDWLMQEVAADMAKEARQAPDPGPALQAA
ncbi:LysR substrate-binding domain-containing protein [Sphingosinicella ginsenosidimutans]